MAERKIEFGTTLRTPDNIEALAQQIEGLGFDILGCGEHVTVSYTHLTLPTIYSV